MDRRGFLRGAFGGVVASGVIVAATPREIEAFATPLVKNEPIVVDVLPPQQATSIGEHLYNEHGEIVAIITEIRVDIPQIDITPWGSDVQIYRPGLPYEISISAKGVGPLQLGDGKHAMPRLGGRK